MKLREALRTGLTSKASWTKIYCSAVFYSWGNRNAIHHGKAANSITGLAAIVLGSTRQYLFSNSLEQQFTIQSLGLFQNASWCPPPPLGWLKINVDGALRRNNAGGIGITIRDCHCNLVVAAGWGITHWDSTHVELMAIQYIEHILQDWMFDLDGVIIEGDNASVIDFMHKCQQKEIWKLRLEEGERFNWLKSFHKVLFVHTNREYNKAAHFCAQRAIEDSFVWDIGDNTYTCIPQVFLSILEDDRISFTPS
ncbi:hypothetical protein KFK09_022686 [Dendrobium nobile]|uniref:RNase H type-1 domain-containing protein n=1 Tax=Dendrobium nobile TaxID=94219 RepID=A0A8T3AJU3_DENNO|nr:hypothetical protein KFK09_022686 [Dendrobium nobile]